MKGEDYFGRRKIDAVKLCMTLNDQKKSRNFVAYSNLKINQCFSAIELQKKLGKHFQRVVALELV